MSCKHTTLICNNLISSASLNFIHLPRSIVMIPWCSHHRYFGISLTLPTSLVPPRQLSWWTYTPLTFVYISYMMCIYIHDVYIMLYICKYMYMLHTYLSTCIVAQGSFGFLRSDLISSNSYLLTCTTNISQNLNPSLIPISSLLH